MATVDAVKKLHTSMIDTKGAYEKARGEAQESSVKTLLGEMIALRQKHHEQLHRVLTAMGEQPDESGSFMSTVHRAAVSVRAAVTGVDHNALSSFASGEENILEEYDEALEQDDIHSETLDLLKRQRAALVEKIEQMKTMASKAAP